MTSSTSVAPEITEQRAQNDARIDFAESRRDSTKLTGGRQRHRPLDPGRLLPKERKNGQNKTFKAVRLEDAESVTSQ